MTASAELDFIEVVGNRGNFLHDSTCKSAQKAIWGYDRDIEGIAREESGSFHWRDKHKCLKTDGPKWRAVVQRAAVIRAARVATEQRTKALIDLAVAIVARDALAVEVGAMTPDEVERLAEYENGIRSGDFRPYRVRDLREVAVPKRSDW